MRAKRTDANQQEIVKALRKIGCSVFVTSGVGGGFPDLAIGIRGRTILLECKDGDKSPSQRKLTNLENLFHLTWKGSAHVVNSVQEAIDVVTQKNL